MWPGGDVHPVTILLSVSVQRSRRRSESMPSSTGWSGRRSPGLKSLRRWRRSGVSSSSRCARLVVKWSCRITFGRLISHNQLSEAVRLVLFYLICVVLGFSPTTPSSLQQHIPNLLIPFSETGQQNSVVRQKIPHSVLCNVRWPVVECN